MGRGGIYSLCANTVKTYGLHKGARTVLSSGIHLAYRIHQLAKRNTPSKISYGNLPLLYIYNNLLAGAHLKLIYRVIDNLFKQHIDTVIGRRAISQLSNIHTAPAPYMLIPR